MIDRFNLKNCAYKSLLELATDEGINASGRDEVYGCIFGRDSAITILKILRAHTKQPSLDLLEISRRGLLTLVALQGKEFNLESGEQPGKFIHEFRRDKYEHLLQLDKPWFVYPDGLMRIYDSIDSTPLTLIALYKYWQLTQDHEFLISVLPAVENGLNWIITYGDQDKDFLLEYTLDPLRKSGGLVVQSWTDSQESLRQSDGSFPLYPIAPVEVQGYAWLALKLWGKFYLETNPQFGKKLLGQAKSLKETFNKTFIYRSKGQLNIAQALDGHKQQIKTVTPNPLLCLWSAYLTENETESIFETDLIPEIVNRAFESDLFVDDAGLRTMSELAETYNPNQDSYHNGSFWPVLNGMVVEGLENFSYWAEANRLAHASLIPIQYFNSPIELYVKDGQGGYREYRNEHGQVSCKQQAWSAAVLLDLTTDAIAN